MVGNGMCTLFRHRSVHSGKKALHSANAIRVETIYDTTGEIGLDVQTGW
jgi:hypothetical protein